MTVRSRESGGVVVVSLDGELDMTTADKAAVALRDAATHGTAIVLDMTGLRFFSSAGLNLLLQLHEAVRTKHVVVHLAGDQRAVTRPLELTGLADLFPIHPTLTAALDSCR